MKDSKFSIEAKEGRIETTIKGMGEDIINSIARTMVEDEDVNDLVKDAMGLAIRKRVEKDMGKLSTIFWLEKDMDSKDIETRVAGNTDDMSGMLAISCIKHKRIREVLEDALELVKYFDEFIEGSENIDDMLNDILSR